MAQTTKPVVLDETAKETNNVLRRIAENIENDNEDYEALSSRVSELNNKLNNKADNRFLWKKVATITGGITTTNGVTLNLPYTTFSGKELMVTAYGRNYKTGAGSPDYVSASGRTTYFTGGLASNGTVRVQYAFEYANINTDPNSCIVKIYKDGTLSTIPTTLEVWVRDII